MEVFQQSPQPGAHTPPPERARAARPLPSALPAIQGGVRGRCCDTPGPDSGAWSLGPAGAAIDGVSAPGPGVSQRGSSRRAGPGRAEPPVSGRARGGCGGSGRCRSHSPIPTLGPGSAARALPPPPEPPAVPAPPSRAVSPSPVAVLTSPPPPGRAGKGRPRLRPARGGHTAGPGGAGSESCTAVPKRGNTGLHTGPASWAP